MNWNRWTHCLLRNKDCGASRTLVGDIVLITLFVNDGESRWDENAIETFLQKVREAACLLEAAAAKYGVKLQLSAAKAAVTTDRICRPPQCEWALDILKQYDVENTEEFQRRYEEKFQCNEAPVLLVFNKTFRSCASTADVMYPQWDEYSVLKQDIHPWGIVHELLHQFGAVDLYYPETVKSAAACYLPNSYMCDGYMVDPLTAYLIGWTDELNTQAKCFLDQTKNLTRNDIVLAVNQEWGKWK